MLICLHQGPFREKNKEKQKITLNNLAEIEETTTDNQISVCYNFIMKSMKELYSNSIQIFISKQVPENDHALVCIKGGTNVTEL